MSSIGANDLVLLINKRTIRNLAISRDHQFEQTVGLGVLALDVASEFIPGAAEWHDRGLEHPDEQTANIAMVVPRLLYATSNNQFGAIPGNSDVEKLLNRLRRYDEIASGPTVATLEEDAVLFDMPLNNPCPIVFRADTNRRFTFFRDEWFVNNGPSFLEVVNNGLEMTIKGTAWRGNLFSRNRAQKSPTHEFEMKLRYEVEFINNSDLNLGPVPFVMIADPPPPTTAGAPSLPAKGKHVFARSFGQDGNQFVLPALVPDAEDPNKLVQPRNLVGAIFQGSLDDQIYETEDGEPIYRVEGRSDDEPQRYVIRKIDDPSHTILAEAVAGRMVLRFKEMSSLNFTPNDVSAAEKAAIGNSLCKIHPTLSQAFTCEDIDDDMAIPLAMLELLGATSLDIPVMPRSVVVPTKAQIVTVDNGLPGPLDSVWSDAITCELDTSRYFPDANQDRQAFGVSGTIDPNTTGGDFLNFSLGADFSVAVSQSFIQPMLDQVGQGIKDQIAKNKPPGLDTSTLQFSATIGDDVLMIHVEGEGEVETPWPLPDVGYDFTADVRIRFRTQKSVEIDGSGNPLDRFNCQIPPPVLDSLGLSVDENRLELPSQSAPNSLPDRNPLSFHGYNDPENGIACFGFCPEVERLPPPVYDSDGNEIVIDDPDNPPQLCDSKNQRRDNPQRLGQASFDPDINPFLKPEWVIVPIPPSEDDDLDVSVAVSAWAIIVSIVLAAIGAAAAAGLFIGFLATGPAALIVLTVGLIMLPFVNIIASAIATGEALDSAKKQALQTVDLDLAPTSFLSMHLENPLQRKPYNWEAAASGQKGAFISRYHIVVQGAGPNEGL